MKLGLKFKSKIELKINVKTKLEQILGSIGPYSLSPSNCNSTTIGRFLTFQFLIRLKISLTQGT